MTAQLVSQLKKMMAIIAVKYADEIAAVREGRVKGIKEQLVEFERNNPNRPKMSLAEILEANYRLARERTKCR